MIKAMRCFEKLPGDVHFQKVHSLSVAFEPLAVWNKELEGQKKKTSVENMYPVASEPVSMYWYSE
jgi:hypothetical protein